MNSRHVCLITLFCFAGMVLGARGRSLQNLTEFSIAEALSPVGSESANECKLFYSWLPCSYGILGQLFLIVAYGSLYIIGESIVAAGGELIFEVNGTLGANLFRVLSAIPHAVLLLVLGLTVSKENAQSKVSIGVGLLVGSTVFYLTAVWGFCVYVGKRDLQATETQVAEEDPKTFSLFGSGVSTSIWTKHAARVMAFSIIPFVVTEIPHILKFSSSGQHVTILIALIVSVILTFSYFFYEFYYEPNLQKSRIDFVEHKHVMSGILIYLDSCAPGQLLTSNGEPNKEVLEMLFNDHDTNNDGFVSPDEIKELIMKIQTDDQLTDLYMINHAGNIMNDFDTSHDSQIDKEEFIEGISKWLEKAKHSRTASTSHRPGHRTLKKYSFSSFRKGIKQEHYMMVSERTNGEEGVTSPKWTSFKAVMMLLFGTSIAALFAEPLIHAVHDFSDATSISTFAVSFVVLPLATSYSETMSAIKMARQKTQTTVSSTLSELYVMATVNNLLCLSFFLAIVYIKGLTWDFPEEVLILAFVCMVMGALTSFRTVFPLWLSLVAILFYPLSLTLVFVLHSVF